MNASPVSQVASPAFPLDDEPVKIPPLGRRMREAAGALRVLVRDHGRLDQVLVFSQAMNAGVIARNIGRLGSLPDGKRLLAEKPRIDRAHVDFDALRRLDDGTLGREYVRFLDDHAIGPEPFEELPRHVDPRAAWVMLRMRQTHDLWHVLTGYEPDVRGEVLLLTFTYAQLGIPSALALAALGTLRYVGPSFSHLANLRTAFRRGKATQFLPTFRWEENWATPLAEVRARLGCPVLEMA